MRCRSVLLLTLLSLAATGSAQAQVVFHESAPALIAKANPDDLVARIMSFDRNHDGKVTKDELNERMQNLVALVDANGDGALDSTELRTVATAPQAAAVRGFPHSGGYGFGDDVGLSSRSHIEGAIEDLRLAPSIREQALAVARTFADTLEASSSAALLKEMETVLTAEQVASIRQALDRPMRRVVTFVVAESGSNAPKVQFLMDGTEQQVSLIVSELRHKLPVAQERQALDALERFREQRRMGSAERSALLEQLSGILGDAERDDLRAALERRPLVRAGGILGARALKAIDVSDASDVIVRATVR